MAYTYLILNTVFLVCIVVLIAKYLRKPSKAWWVMCGTLLVLTAIFDSIIIWAGIVGYDSNKILGLTIGNAPIEDFFYAILAAVIVPALWQRFERTPANTHPTKGSK